MADEFAVHQVGSNGPGFEANLKKKLADMSQGGYELIQLEFLKKTTEQRQLGTYNKGEPPSPSNSATYTEEVAAAYAVFKKK